MFCLLDDYRVVHPGIDLKGFLHDHRVTVDPVDHTYKVDKRGTT